MNEDRIESLLQEHFAPLRMPLPRRSRRPLAWGAGVLGAGGAAAALAAALTFAPRELSAQEVMALGDARLRDVPYVEIRARLGDAPFGEPDVISQDGWLIRNDVGGSGPEWAQDRKEKIMRMTLRTEEGEYLYNPRADFLLFSPGVRALNRDQLFSSLVLEHYTTPREFPMIVTKKNLSGTEVRSSPFIVAGKPERLKDQGQEYTAIRLITDPKRTFDIVKMTAQAAFHRDGRPAWLEFRFAKGFMDDRPTTRIEFAYPSSPSADLEKFPIGRSPDLDMSEVLPAAARARGAADVPCLPYRLNDGFVLLDCGPQRNLQQAAGDRAHFKKIPGFTQPPDGSKNAGRTQVLVDDQGRPWLVHNPGRNIDELPLLCVLSALRPEESVRPTFWGLAPIKPEAPGQEPRLLRAAYLDHRMPEYVSGLIRARAAAVAGRATEARAAADWAMSAASEEFGNDAILRDTLVRWGILPPEEGFGEWPPTVIRR